VSWYGKFGKRALDIVLSSAALVALSPLLLLTAALIRLEDKGPALYRQKRIGKDGREFTLLKFRSMPVNTGNLPSAQAGSLRITRIGNAIRRTNIDELPQLLNILRGDMSLVGPRPALSTQANLLDRRASGGALVCRPGLTGLAQINSYDFMPDTEKAAFDCSYAKRISLWMDTTIIARTFAYLRRRPPVY
jgi:O-antigen biosynthesis protein WbqP